MMEAAQVSLSCLSFKTRQARAFVVRMLPLDRSQLPPNDEGARAGSSMASIESTMVVGRSESEKRGSEARTHENSKFEFAFPSWPCSF